MGSLRTPIGPLPSSIYWRRRVVVLLLLLLVGALVFWGLRSGPSTGTTAGEDDGGGDTPPASITPGATDTESHIDERPGGAEDDDAEDDDSDGETGNGADGDADGDGAADGDDADESAAVGGSEAPGGEAGDLPLCESGDRITVSLRSEENAYSPDEEPALRLTLENTSGTDCQADVGDDALTVVLSQGDEEVWNSAHCPDGAGSRMVEVPAGDTATHAVDWDRRVSDAAECDAEGAAAPEGTYLAEATLDGFGTVQTTFRLDAA